LDDAEVEDLVEDAVDEAVDEAIDEDLVDEDVDQELVDVIADAVIDELLDEDPTTPEEGAFVARQIARIPAGVKRPASRRKTARGLFAAIAHRDFDALKAYSLPDN